MLFDESNRDYHRTQAISLSKLWQYHESPRKYRFGTREETDAMRLGTAFHACVLEPDEWAKYEDAPKEVYKTKADKEQTCRILNANCVDPFSEEDLAEIMTLNADPIKAAFAAKERKPTITPENRDMLENMKKALQSRDDIAPLLFGDGFSEVVYRTGMSTFGFPLQCRTDRLAFVDGKPCIVDVKTIDSLDSIDKAMTQRGYYRAPSFYRSVIRTVTGYDEPIPFYFVFVEKGEDPACSLQEVFSDHQTLAMGEINADLKRLAQSIREDDWRDEAEKGKRTYFLPGWMVHRLGTL